MSIPHTEQCAVNHPGRWGVTKAGGIVCDCGAGARALRQQASETDVPGVTQAMIDAAIVAYRKAHAEIAANPKELPDLYGYPMAAAIRAAIRDCDKGIGGPYLIGGRFVSSPP